MGHKVNPVGIRLGISKDWNSKWFAGKRDYAQHLVADLKVRALLKDRLAQAGVSKIQIERPARNARITIHTARPGVVIGKKGEDIEKLRKDVSEIMGVPAHINVNVVGRLNGAEIARSEWYREGRVPLHTLRADIDYGLAEAKTTYGVIGVKVWIYKGEIFDFAAVGQAAKEEERNENAQPTRRPRPDRDDEAPRRERAPRGRREGASK